jgi:hypothetical protein
MARRAVAVAVGSVAITAGGLAVVGIAGAQEDPADGGTPGPRPAFCDQTPEEREANREARRAEYVTDVAAELGIDPAELDQAMRNVALEHLDERLAAGIAAGRITQAEADELRAAAEAGDLRELLAERHPRLGQLRMRVLDRVCS